MTHAPRSTHSRHGWRGGVPVGVGDDPTPLVHEQPLVGTVLLVDVPARTPVVVGPGGLGSEHDGPGLRPATTFGAFLAEVPGADFRLRSGVGVAHLLDGVPGGPCPQALGLEFGVGVLARLALTRHAVLERDHVHLPEHHPPKVAISRLVGSLKGVSARRLRQEFPGHIRRYLWGDHFRSLSYFAASCGGARLAPVKEYIAHQKRPGRGRRCGLVFWCGSPLA